MYYYTCWKKHLWLRLSVCCLQSTNKSTNILTSSCTGLLCRKTCAKTKNEDLILVTFSDNQCCRRKKQKWNIFLAICVFFKQLLIAIVQCKKTRLWKIRTGELELYSSRASLQGPHEPDQFQVESNWLWFLNGRSVAIQWVPQFK